MGKSDKKFVNTSKAQEYELEDWLYRNGFSKKQSNVNELKTIIDEKLKKGNTANNITWDELDYALEERPTWFSDLAEIGK